MVWNDQSATPAAFEENVTSDKLKNGHFSMDRTTNGYGVKDEVEDNTRQTETKKDIPATAILARFVSNANTKLLTPIIREKLKEYLIDYIGVTVSAAHSSESTEAIFKAILALGAEQGSSTVILKGKRFTPHYAGLLNATFGHSLDFDDTYAAGTLHAGVTAISAGITQAELSNNTVDEFLIAVAVGYELICRLGKELGNEAYSRGFHNTSTTGVFGAVATIAVLKRLSVETIENAFGLAGSKAAGSMQYLENGSWNKRLHPGFAVHDAFMCLALAEAGAIGATKIFEGKFGFLHGYSPKEDKDLVYLTADLGKRWTFLETALKPYPACRMTHGLIELAGKSGKSASGKEVQAITIKLSPANASVVGARNPNKVHPKNMVDAQFSAYFQTAHSFLHGAESGIQCYERIDDPEIYELSEKISCESDTDLSAMASRMKIEYADGRIDDLDIPFPLGEAEHPFTRDQVYAKFFSLVTPVFGQERAIEIRDVVENLEQHNVPELLALLC